MSKNVVIFIYLLTISLSSQAQNTKQPNSKTNTTKQTMDLTILTNPTVKNAIEALQANDRKAWYSYFTSDATFSDDGNSMNFKSFFDNAFAHKEKFLTLDKVENDGKQLSGSFYAGQWGTFKVYFKFMITPEGKISHLDIGQAN